MRAKDLTARTLGYITYILHQKVTLQVFSKMKTYGIWIGVHWKEWQNLHIVADSCTTGRLPLETHKKGKVVRNYRT